MNKVFHRDETMLVRLFKRIQIRPSQRFYEQMASAPWSIRPSPAKTHLSFPRRLATVVSATMLLVLIAVPLRSLAQQVFHHFTQAETDVIDQPVFLEATPEQPALGDLTDVQRASEVAGFAIRLPQDLPAGLQIVSTSINPGSVSITYSNGQTTLIFLQGLKSESTFYVGAGASVEAIFVDGVTGEYVRGGWRQVNDDLVWDNTLPESLLFWEKNGIRYGLLVQAGDISQDTLIRIADSLR